MFGPLDTFVRRHIGSNDAEIGEMLRALGLGTIDALVQETVPASIRAARSLAIDASGENRAPGEQEMLDHFHKVFAPIAAKHKGYIDLKMLKLSKHIQGPTLPKAINYRFQLTYESEALRLAWVTSADHDKVWPGIGNTLLDQNFQVYVFDNV